MEELLRFVAIRAPERIEPKNNYRLVSLDIDSLFQNQIRQATREARPDIAKKYLKSAEFIAEPNSNPLGEILLRVIENVDLDKIPPETLAQKVIDAVDENSQKNTSIGVSTPDAQNLMPAITPKIQVQIQNLIEQSNWKELKNKLADSLIALNLYQDDKLHLTSSHESLIYLMNFLEQGASKGFSQLNIQDISQSLLTTKISLTPEIATAQNEKEDPTFNENPNDNNTSSFSVVMQGNFFLISLKMV